MAEPGSRHKQKVLAHAARSLGTARRRAKTRGELIALYKRFYKIENHRIKLLHRAGGGGVEIARRRSELLDTVLRNLVSGMFDPEETGKPEGYPFTLVAVGGYGRGTLNPGSDVDLLFLCPGNASALGKETGDRIGEIIAMLYDVGFKVGHATRTVKECIRQANADNPTKTAMLDTRFILGDEALYRKLVERFEKECLQGKEAEYLEVRRRDFLSRHEKHGKTVYLQEPNVKEGCGGLRDYQNILWVSRVKLGVRDLAELVETHRMLSRPAYRAMVKAHDFLMRVRNEMHWAERGSTDQLTLRLQGVVATNLGYPQPSMLRRIEAFMRDYYRHTRALYLHSTSVMQSFRLLQEEERGSGLIGFLARRADAEERFDGFRSAKGLIYPEHPEIFQEDPARLMRLFRHTQQRHLRLSPAIRKLVKRSHSLVNKTFRYSKANRVVFEEILSARGEVGRTLRQMHRVGFLGRYLPEFGALDCLVQHEFFHRFTADEHTLRCIDILDSLVDESDPRFAFYRKLFRDLEDCSVLYLALLLHDTGRAENVRFHTDSSTVLATRVCRRLQIGGERRRLLLFLVDNHLTFWKTATTKNLEDEDTIQEFAAVMRDRAHMEALLLLTHADSRGTNDEGWTTWKEMLMLQLFRSTCAYLEDTGTFARSFLEAREALRAEVEPRFDPSWAAELEVHFTGMPERYFPFRDADAVERHVRLFRRFMERTVATPGLGALHPVVEWISVPASGHTQVEVCCWDRSHLLAKIAGALASEGINILGADLFTRADNLVLDLFRVCDTNFEPIRSERVRQRVETLLNQLLDGSVDWTALGDRFAPAKTPDEELARTFPSRVWFSNEANRRHTVLEVQALDRLGLLYDLFRVLGRHRIEVAVARIITEKGAAIDTFYLTDAEGNKILDRDLLGAAQADLEAVLAAC
jgi:[protein-PII] uridylyltransferase